MIVKRGSVVSHSVASEWGVGKVVEVDDIRATIRFNDGMVRKITSSHFTDLKPANPSSYTPPVKGAEPPKPRRRTAATKPKPAPKSKSAPKPKPVKKLALAEEGGQEL